jgi:hypothetical protein
LTSSKHFTIEEAKRIGEALGIDWSKFDVEQFRMGLNVELEHGKRALAHLNEFSDYYTRLQKMETEAGENMHKTKK